MIPGEYNNRVDVRGHKYVFGPTQTHFQNTNENHFQNTKRRMKNNSLQITSDSWHEKSKFRL